MSAAGLEGSSTAQSQVQKEGPVVRDGQSTAEAPQRHAAVSEQKASHLSNVHLATQADYSRLGRKQHSTESVPKGKIQPKVDESWLRREQLIT